MIGRLNHVAIAVPDLAAAAGLRRRVSLALHWCLCWCAGVLVSESAVRAGESMSRRTAELVPSLLNGPACP